jgi:hypothetical protein
MATITGTIKDSQGNGIQTQLKFVPLTSPIVISTDVNVGALPVAVTSSSGALASMVLVEGRYRVEVANGEAFEIDVPPGSASYDIANLVSSGTAASSAYQLAGTFSGHGSPEGVVTANPGSTYEDLDTGGLWQKRTGTGSEGWQPQIQ